MALFIFVHGGGMGGWCWKKVKALLEVQGHTVYTPTLTGLGERRHLAHCSVNLDTHIEDIKNIIEYENLKNIILIGHSYGGMVVRGVAEQLPLAITKLIYLDALIPQHGESMFNCLDKKLVQALADSKIHVKNTYLVPTPAIEHYKLVHEEDSIWAAQRLTPHPLECFTQPISLANTTSIPYDIAFIKCTQDNALNPMTLRAKDRGIKCYSLDAGHFPMINDAQILSELLLAIAT